MPVKRGPYLIRSNHAKRTATAFREFARKADRGEAIGGAVTLWTHNDVPDSRLVGFLDDRPEYAIRALLRFLLVLALDD